ncbi:MAG: Mov34/MPN/PAD-1 family protein [Candidatus Hadarchaeaceae archaeon]
MNLKLNRDGLKAVDGHALKNFPRECCGLLLGKFGKNVIEVKAVVETENVLGSSVAFEVDAELVFKTIKRAEKSGLELVGIYHSHPNIAAYVSARDSEIMKLWPGVAWLIVSVVKDHIPERKAYVLKNGKIQELEIETS